MSATEVEEAGWVRRVQRSGDRDAAGLLVRAHYGEIQRFVERQLPGRGVAADLTQDVFVAALAHIGRFDAGKASFRTWLYRIATNKVIDHVRRQRRWGQPVPVEDVDPVDGLDVSDSATSAVLVGQSLEWLARQPFRVQQVVRWKLFEGGTFAQIGAGLGVPEATVKTVYYRALASARRELSDGEP